MSKLQVTLKMEQCRLAVARTACYMLGLLALQHLPTPAAAQGSDPVCAKLLELQVVKLLSK